MRNLNSPHLFRQFKGIAFILFFIFGCWFGFSQDQKTHTVRIKVVADEEFRKDRDWRFAIKRHVANASSFF
jgi:hypothetical protein